MSFRHGLKWLAAAGLSLAMAGCSASSATSESSVSSANPAESGVDQAEELAGDKLSVLCPTGAPALASLGLADAGAAVEYVDGQDLLVSELSKTDGYDMIIAPVNVGIKTWKDAGAYQLDGILTWGNLYVVSPDENWNESGKTIALFGEQAVPGMVFTDLYPDCQANMEFYPSVSEASAALLSGKADSAMLAQPAAAGAVAKASQDGTTLSIVGDLQTAWQDAHESEQKGYPQAALFVKKDKAEEYASQIGALKTYIENATPEKIEEAVDAYGAEQLGVPNAKLAASTWDAQNIHYVAAKDCKEDLQKFLDVFKIQIPEGIIVE